MGKTDTIVNEKKIGRFAYNQSRVGKGYVSYDLQGRVFQELVSVFNKQDFPIVFSDERNGDMIYHLPKVGSTVRISEAPDSIRAVTSLSAYGDNKKTLEFLEGVLK